MRLDQYRNTIKYDTNVIRMYMDQLNVFSKRIYFNILLNTQNIVFNTKLILPGIKGEVLVN